MSVTPFNPEGPAGAHQEIVRAEEVFQWIGAAFIPETDQVAFLVGGDPPDILPVAIELIRCRAAILILATTR